MGQPTDVTFGRFRFDLAGERVWEGSRTLTLRPKAFAILRYLIARPGELVTKQELLEAVWPSTFIADGVLKESIRQLRDALGDDPAAPQYIETAHRRGYRFVGRIDGSQPTPRRRRTDVEPQPATRETTASEATSSEATSSEATSSEAAPEAVTADVPAAAPPRIHERTEREAGAGVLGREAELAQLREWLTRALRGERSRCRSRASTCCCRLRSSRASRASARRPSSTN